MGMFSWKCKGCGLELHQQELVRLNGTKGIYDGYGGTHNAPFNDLMWNQTRAWHEACYQQATDKEKLDESPSEDAKNQGFGHALEKFMPYPKRSTQYVVRANAKGVEGFKYEFIFNVLGKVLKVRTGYEGMLEQEDWTKNEGEKVESFRESLQKCLSLSPSERSSDDLDTHPDFIKFEAARAEINTRNPFMPKEFSSVEECREVAKMMARNENISEVFIIARTKDGTYNGVVESVKGELT